ncbi:hypothetical protein A6R68_05154, partial [Neotoma lepida]
YTIVFVYYAFCLVLMMLLRPLLVKKIACGLGKSERFKSIYAALYFFPILTVLQAVDPSKLDSSKELNTDVLNPQEHILTLVDSGTGVTKVKLIEVFATMMKHNDDGAVCPRFCVGGTFTECIDQGEPIDWIHPKETDQQDTEEKRGKEVVKKHSLFISYPVTLCLEEQEEKDMSDDTVEEKKRKIRIVTPKIEDLQLEEFDGRRLVFMTKEHQELPEEQERKEEEKEDWRKAEFENFCILMEDVLGKKVKVIIPVGCVFILLY